MYYREAMGAFVVYDVTVPRTFEIVPNWKDSLDKYLNNEDYHLPVVLIGNKCDQPHETNPEGIEAFRKSNGFISWFETSAKTNVGIDEAVRSLVTEILKQDSLELSQPRDDIIDPSQSGQSRNHRCHCP